MRLLATYLRSNVNCGWNRVNLRTTGQRLNYRSQLDQLDENACWLHNKVNDLCYERGCGISQIEDEVHRLRLFIQQYLESFNPFPSISRTRTK